MLIKDREPMQGSIAQLKDIFSLNLSCRKKFLIERELKNIDPAENGGQSAAHFINFYCADSHNWAIIHDLRIESNGYAVCIDHVLINRFFDIYLLESKNYSYGIKITADREFMIFDGRQYQCIDSPLEENQKRIEVLREVLAKNKILPKRLGIRIRPVIAAYILLSPKSNVLRPPGWIFDTSSVITADCLTRFVLLQAKRIKRTCEKIRRLPKNFKAGTLAKAAADLASLHKPCPIDYRQAFGQEEALNTPALGTPTQHVAIHCDYAI